MNQSRLRLMPWGHSQHTASGLCVSKPHKQIGCTAHTLFCVRAPAGLDIVSSFSWVGAVVLGDERAAALVACSFILGVHVVLTNLTSQIQWDFKSVHHECCFTLSITDGEYSSGGMLFCAEGDSSRLCLFTVPEQASLLCLRGKLIWRRCPWLHFCLCPCKAPRVSKPHSHCHSPTVIDG